ncbi:MAG: hypothetical protein NTZ93_05095 [Candidatus Beckwithbacteria bacterium]|nr:hypothetical protein [Candidatus Beckwithbacteria bacterium]
MREALQEFVMAKRAVEFFDIQDIGGGYRAKITLAARGIKEVNARISYCEKAWDEEKQIYLGYFLPEDGLPRKARITNIEDASTFDKETGKRRPMMTLTVILPQKDYLSLAAAVV